MRVSSPPTPRSPRVSKGEPLARDQNKCGRRCRMHCTPLSLPSGVTPVCWRCGSLTCAPTGSLMRCLHLSEEAVDLVTGPTRENVKRPALRTTLHRVCPRASIDSEGERVEEEADDHTYDQRDRTNFHHTWDRGLVGSREGVDEPQDDPVNRDHHVRAVPKERREVGSPFAGGFNVPLRTTCATALPWSAGETSGSYLVP